MSDSDYTTNHEGIVLVTQLAQEWGQSTSNIRKWLLTQGFQFTQVRGGKENGYQPMIALTNEEADKARDIRASMGYTSDGKISSTGEGSKGFFYIIQIVPDLEPRRVKLGYASDVDHRLQQYRTLSPTVTLCRCWPCDVSWEQAAMASTTRVECEHIGGEVYQCEDLGRLVERAEAFFGLMP